MDRGVSIPCVRCQNSMGRGVNIPWIVGSRYHGYGVGDIMCRVIKIPWLRGSI